jgi:hypothetical protein
MEYRVWDNYNLPKRYNNEYSRDNQNKVLPKKSKSVEICDDEKEEDSNNSNNDFWDDVKLETHSIDYPRKTNANKTKIK